MAGNTVIDDTGVIKNDIGEGAGDVADTAILRGRNVAGMLWRGRRCCTAVAGRTVIHDAGMIKGGTGKIRAVMTGAAILGGGNMCCRHSSRPQFFMGPIVAAGTIPGDVVVSENRWRERRVGMAEVTILARWEMVRCGLLRRGESTVVTTFAAAGDIRVSRSQECGCSKCGGVDMTHTAIIQCRNMINCFAG